MSESSQNKRPREDLIDQNLKRIFDQTLDEGVPDRFKNLLEQLKQQDVDKGTGN